MSGDELQLHENAGGAMSDDSELQLHDDEGTSKDRKRKRGYTTAKKLEAVEYAKKFSKRAAGKKFNVHRKRIQEWCRQEPQLRQQMYVLINHY